MVIAIEHTAKIANRATAYRAEVYMNYKEKRDDEPQNNMNHIR